MRVFVAGGTGVLGQRHDGQDRQHEPERRHRRDARREGRGVRGAAPLPLGIAYRLLGSVGDAEDAVPEAWLRWEATSTRPASTRAFLSAVVTRISVDVLRSARVRREQYVGPWFPEPVLADPYQDPERSAELADSPPAFGREVPPCPWPRCCCSNG